MYLVVIKVSGDKSEAYRRVGQIPLDSRSKIIKRYRTGALINVKRARAGWVGRGHAEGNKNRASWRARIAYGIRTNDKRADFSIGETFDRRIGTNRAGVSSYLRAFQSVANDAAVIIVLTVNYSANIRCGNRRVKETGLGRTNARASVDRKFVGCDFTRNYRGRSKKRGKKGDKNIRHAVSRELWDTRGVLLSGESRIQISVPRYASIRSTSNTTPPSRRIALFPL